MKGSQASTFAGFVDRLESACHGALEDLRREHPADEPELDRLSEVLARAFRAAADETTPATGEMADVMADGSGSSALLRRLERHRPAEARYRLVDEVARGGMGAILEIWDDDLKRQLAMKIILGDEGAREGTPSVDPRVLARFVEEAQVTGQLDHPGIVPVHELGLDGQGRVYFTMRLVKGEDLRAVLRRIRTDVDGWTVTRGLGVLLRVCETMAFAHERGVVHRDLKPSNVMIGRFGETYVMDWGLARTQGRADGRDLRIADDPSDRSAIRTDRGEAATPGSPLMTMDGDVVGTPTYMSPEQARGELEHLGKHSDVYSVGAMLYELLAGRAPYDRPGVRESQRAVLQRVIEGPPRPLHELAPRAAPELVAICEKAMARPTDLRYGDMGQMADDLRAYLENRVVKAHRTGAVIELRKWVARNRATAASIVAVTLILVVAGFSIAWVERQRRATVVRDLDERTAAALLAEVDELWPIAPRTVSRMQTWLAAARALEERGGAYAQELGPLSAGHDAARAVLAAGDDRELDHLRYRRAYWHDVLERWSDGTPEANDPVDDAAAAAILERERADLDERIARRQQDLRLARRAAAFAADAETRRLFDLVTDLNALSDPDRGAIVEVERRLALADGLAERTVTRHRDAWEEAVGSIADPSGPYGGLVIEPQVGLVPLGANAAGLWEFWHELSGVRPERREDGAWRVAADTGIVLVLVPGGRYSLGAQDTDPAGRNYCPPEVTGGVGLLASDELVRDVELDPFFLARHELTQGQWHRLTGEQPSENYAGSKFAGLPMISRSHPVEHVSWDDCTAALRRVGLSLPTEAQWEVAARGGTETPFYTGSTLDSLHGAVNQGDASVARAGSAAPIRYDDGWPIHAPVDHYPANPWGFESILGNVSEWCRDWHAESCYRIETVPGTGEMLPAHSTTRTNRGGNYRYLPSDLRVSRRRRRVPSFRNAEIGVRAARAFDAQQHP